MTTDFDYDLSAIILKAHRDRDAAVAKDLRRFGAWVAHFFKAQDKAAPTHGRTA